MAQPSPAPPIARYGAFAVFLGMSLGALLWFGWSLADMLQAMYAKNPVVDVNKGAMYMLGIGIGLSCLTYSILHQGILKKTLSKQLEARITRIAFIGLGLMFIVPHAVHYPAEHFLEGRAYEICAGASHQWMLYAKIVYTNDANACKRLTDYKNRFNRPRSVPSRSGND